MQIQNWATPQKNGLYVASDNMRISRSNKRKALVGGGGGGWLNRYGGNLPISWVS